MKDETRLIKAYKLCKTELREVAKHEKEVNRFWYLKNILDDPDGNLVPGDKASIEKEQDELRKLLSNRGYSNTDDENKLEDDFYRIALRLVNALEDVAKNSVPNIYNPKFCNKYDHFTQEAYFMGPGYCHLSIQRDGGDKFCVSPYGYIYRNGRIFGRISKDGAILNIKLGRYGRIQYV